MLIGSLVASGSIFAAAPFILFIGSVTLIGAGIISFLNSLEGCGNASSIQFWIALTIYLGLNALSSYLGRLVKYLIPGFLIGNLLDQLSSGAIGGLNSACRVRY